MSKKFEQPKLCPTSTSVDQPHAVRSPAAVRERQGRHMNSSTAHAAVVHAQALHAPPQETAADKQKKAEQGEPQVTQKDGVDMLEQRARPESADPHVAATGEVEPA